MKMGFQSGTLMSNRLNLNTTQSASRFYQTGEDFISKLLNRRWSLLNPDTKIHQILLSSTQTLHGSQFADITYKNNTCPSLGDDLALTKDQNLSFYVLRDDLLHPFVNGNKARKLDGLLPLMEDHLVTDVVTCGGCQSAHATAVAVSCAERGLKSHLLLRGEQPKILTGYNLISKMYGNVTYVPRSLYSNREEMLKRHANMVAGNSGSVLWFTDVLESAFISQSHGVSISLQVNTPRSAEPRKVVIVNEGAGDAVALIGVFRLVQYLSQDHFFGKDMAIKLVVDAGTGTTAVGLGIGALCLGLPWEVNAVMLADTIDGYREQEKKLISELKKFCALSHVDYGFNGVDGGIVNWLERTTPRKFGNALEGEVETCHQIAQQTGILVDPIYTLAAWELATTLTKIEAKDGAKVVMLHTGGTLGMFGLAQRYTSYFNKLKDGEY